LKCLKQRLTRIEKSIDGYFSIMFHDFQVINGQPKILNQTLLGLDIPGKVKKFSDGCTKIKVLLIPNSATWIGNKCFSGCLALSYITISDSVFS
jgi:hypothetical protein